MNVVIVAALKQALDAKERTVEWELGGFKGPVPAGTTLRNRLKAAIDRLEQLADDYDAIRNELALQESNLREAIGVGEVSVSRCAP